MFLLATFGKGAISRTRGSNSCGASPRFAGQLSHRLRFVNKSVVTTGKRGRITGRGTENYSPPCRGHSRRQASRGGRSRDLPSSDGHRPSGVLKKRLWLSRPGSPPGAAAAPAGRRPSGSATPLPFPREPAGGAKVELCVRSSCLASRPAYRRELGLPSGSPSVSRGFCVSGPFRADGRGTGRAGQ